MTPLDWLNAAFLVAIGLFLGLAAHGLAGLASDGAWLVAAGLVVGGGGLFILLLWFDGLLDRAFARFFPGGVRPVSLPSRTGRKPLALLAGLPCGLVLGVVLAEMGLSVAILGLF
jgi:hypothetical protein